MLLPKWQKQMKNVLHRRSSDLKVRQPRGRVTRQPAPHRKRLLVAGFAQDVKAVPLKRRLPVGLLKPPCVLKTVSNRVHKVMVARKVVAQQPLLLVDGAGVVAAVAFVVQFVVYPLFPRQERRTFPLLGSHHDTK